MGREGKACKWGDNGCHHWYGGGANRHCDLQGWLAALLADLAQGITGQCPAGQSEKKARGKRSTQLSRPPRIHAHH